MPRNQERSSAAARTVPTWARKLKSLFTFIAGLGLGGAVTGLIAHDVERRRNDVIALLDDQITKLYQPFLVESGRNDGAWCVFVEGKWRATNLEKPNCLDPTKAYWNTPTMPDEDVQRWRTQMRLNFQPLNESLERIIVDNRGLIVGGVMPPKWQELLDHVSAYRGILAEWRDDDRQQRPNAFTQVQENVPVKHQYPPGLTDCSRKLLRLLQNEQSYVRAAFYRTATSGQEYEMPEECR